MQVELITEKVGKEYRTVAMTKGTYQGRPTLDVVAGWCAKTKARSIELVKQELTQTFGQFTVA